MVGTTSSHTRAVTAARRRAQGDPPPEPDAAKGSPATIDVDRWEPGPQRPRLRPATLHVWRADLTALDGQVVALLNTDERARAERMPRQGADRWMRARGVLRALLGRYLACDARSLRFSLGPYGKPALRGDHARLHFNLSHSGPLALYAFAEDCEVGVDVQLGRAPDPLRANAMRPAALAERAFGPAAARRLAELAPAAREHEFLRLWTRHEAHLKCLGEGLRAEATVGCDEPWVGQLELGARSAAEAPDPPHAPVAAAVAMQRAPRRLRCWEWTPGD